MDKDTTDQIEKNKEAISLLNTWLKERIQSSIDYDKESYNRLKHRLEETDLKEKALNVIEMICEIESSRSDDVKRVLGLIYRIAHSASDSTCEHPKWIEELESIYSKMKQDGIL